MNTIQKMIPLQQTDGIQTINARDLWTFLESKQDFSNWIKKRIEQYDFVEDEDFVTLNRKIERQILIDYHISLDMAKELSMVERTPRGKEARQYFIECEKRLISRNPLDVLQEMLEVCRLLTVPVAIAQVESIKEVKKQTGFDYTPLLKHSAEQDHIPEEDMMLEPTDMAKVLGFDSGRKVNQILVSLGLQYKDDNGLWMPTKKGNPLCSRHQWSSDNKSGYNYKWNVSVVKELIKEIKGE